MTLSQLRQSRFLALVVLAQFFVTHEVRAGNVGSNHNSIRALSKVLRWNARNNEIPSTSSYNLSSDSSFVPSYIPTSAPPTVNYRNHTRPPFNQNQSPPIDHTALPTLSHIPTDSPSASPTDIPSVHPTDIPSTLHTGTPSNELSNIPSTNPTGEVSVSPTGAPSNELSNIPSTNPTGEVSASPTDKTTGEPSTEPSGVPSTKLSDAPSTEPSDVPSTKPSDAPSIAFFVVTSIGGNEGNVDRLDNSSDVSLGFLIGGSILGVLLSAGAGVYYKKVLSRREQKGQSLNDENSAGYDIEDSGKFQNEDAL